MTFKWQGDHLLRTFFCLRGQKRPLKGRKRKVVNVRICIHLIEPKNVLNFLIFKIIL